MAYLAFTVAGTFAFIFPAQVILNSLQAVLVYAWAGFLAGGGLLALVGSLRRTWAGELVGLPLLAASSAVFGGALLGYGQTSAAIAIGFVFLGISGSQVARWMDLLPLPKISREVDDDGS